MKKKRRSHRYDINRACSLDMDTNMGKYKKCLSMMMYSCINRYVHVLSDKQTFEAQFMAKLTLS